MIAGFAGNPAPGRAICALKRPPCRVGKPPVRRAEIPEGCPGPRRITCHERPRSRTLPGAEKLAARARARWQRRHPTDSLGSESETPNPKFQTANDATPADDALRSERAGVVREAVAALPAELREAVVLFEYEDKSHAEIAAIVGVTAKAVETRFYRARQQLRKTLARYLV
ncbi:MAG TPA: sigma-70 family RNA polymerase sigma factor [Opitutaceae bacterium]|nr:sigma-70 family RNA polymerase sigma factor [Opitutaceae bacterium]